MIFYERVQVVSRLGDSGPFDIVVDESLPCDLSPLSSDEPQYLDTAASGDLPSIEYKLYYKRDIVTRLHRINWRGRAAEVVGSPERHYVKGRLHHCEILVKFID